LIIGKHGGYPKKRTLVKFPVSSIPSGAIIEEATLKLYYYAKHKPSWVSETFVNREVQAHVVFTNWNEGTARVDYPWSGYSTFGLEPDPEFPPFADYYQEMEDVETFTSTTGVWKEWDVKRAVENWVSGHWQNNGLVLWATNEDVEGYDVRMYSKEFTTDTSKCPRLEVTYRKPVQALYYLKDHLGSVRVTVNQQGQMVGFDDYYPYGQQIPGRSSNSANPRYYDPEVGRWLSMDPLADQYPSLSPYVYAANNPLRYIDPNGMELQGDSTQLAELAEETNNALKKSGIDDASVSVESIPEKKTGLAGWFANTWLGKKLGLSDTKKVFFLATLGEGWKVVNTGNEWKDKGVKMLGEMLDAETVFYYENSDDFRGRSSTGQLDENNLWMAPKIYQEREKRDFFAVFMHEFVGHGHPLSPNAIDVDKQGTHLIAAPWGHHGKHDHGAKKDNKPAGGYLGYPVIFKR